MYMFNKIVKFIIKWILIALAIYMGFWIVLIGLAFLLLGAILYRIQTENNLNGGIYYNGSHYDHHNDKYF